MAEVEKVSAVVTTTATATASVAASASEIPTAVNSDAGGGGSSADLGTSPTQERSSNSHPHDSEYDTASDLEGGDEYDDEDELDDDDDEEGDSVTDEDDEGESMTDDDDGRPHAAGGMMPGEKTDAAAVAAAEAQKKVDEDRSNPQYIPKRGTFYEHDDRTAEGETDVNAIPDGSSEQPEGGVSGAGAKSPQSPTISQASKTMKKWLPASAVERWSHDRFDANEQAPKSRTELVSAYGYDIRTEDAPPRARRRRRYGRGPTKYSRNWEDESAYLKASNKERKPPRAADFPALNERGGKVQRSLRGNREEKENHMSKRQSSEGCSGSGSGSGSGMQRAVPHIDDRRGEGRIETKGNKHKNYGRQGNVPAGRQTAMEFKQKQRSGQMHTSSSNSSSQHNRVEVQMDRESGIRVQSTHNNVINEQQKGLTKTQGQTKQMQMQQNDLYQQQNVGGNRMHEHASYQQLQQQVLPQQQQALSMRQPLPPKTTSSSNLSQRLQAVQQRNDPSHVGSIQMHSLAQQNHLLNQQQQQQQQQAQPIGNMILPQPPQQQQQQQQASQGMAPQPQQQQALVPQEQRGPPKRYSSLRRSQHEAQHIAEQHQLQQLHMQQQQQPPLLLQDQHMLQAAAAANLMLYHPDNLQAQMQALQVGPAPPVTAKQPAYTNQAPPPPQAYANAASSGGGPPAAYYVAAAPDTYAAANAQVAQTAQYAPQQPPPNYLPQAPSAAAAVAAAAQLSYPSTTPPTQQTAPGAAPPTAYVPPAVVSGTAGTAGPPAQTAPPNPNQNYTNYQNYNTVGGTTYFVPPPAQTATRPVVLPQRRPTNAIPILPPSEKNKQQRPNTETKEEVKGSAAITSQSSAPIGSAENIDHIIDNMFVQRPAFQPPTATRKSATPSESSAALTESNCSATTLQAEDSSATKDGIGGSANKAEEGAPNVVATSNPTENNSSNASSVTVSTQE